MDLLFPIWRCVYLVCFLWRCQSCNSCDDGVRCSVSGMDSKNVSLVQWKGGTVATTWKSGGVGEMIWQAIIIFLGKCYFFVVGCMILCSKAKGISSQNVPTVERKCPGNKLDSFLQQGWLCLAVGLWAASLNPTVGTSTSAEVPKCWLHWGVASAEKRCHHHCTRHHHFLSFFFCWLVGSPGYPSSASLVGTLGNLVIFASNFWYQKLPKDQPWWANTTWTCATMGSCTLWRKVWAHERKDDEAFCLAIFELVSPDNEHMALHLPWRESSHRNQVKVWHVAEVPHKCWAGTIKMRGFVMNWEHSCLLELVKWINSKYSISLKLETFGVLKKIKIKQHPSWHPSWRNPISPALRLVDRTATGATPPRWGEKKSGGILWIRIWNLKFQTQNSYLS